MSDRRIEAKQKPGVFHKTSVLGIFKWGDKVYIEIVPDFIKVTVQTIIQGRVNPDSMNHSDRWCGYNGLLVLGPHNKSADKV